MKSTPKSWIADLVESRATAPPLECVGHGEAGNISAITETAAGFDAEREWSRAFWSALEPYHTSVYVNFLMDEGEQRIREAYGPAKYARLKALKRRWDPDNFFRLNQNIRPE